jgi:hypothetical protein
MALRAADFIEKKFPDKPRAPIIPVADVITELGDLADAGKIPGVASHSELYVDGGHLSYLGSYAVSLTYIATLYSQDPHKLPDWHSDYGGRRQDIPPAVSRVFKDVVWDVICSHPRSGVDVGLNVRRKLPGEAIVGMPYEFQFEAVGGASRAGASWAIAKGDLPPGVAMDAAGRLSGRPSSVGAFPFEVAVSAGGKTARRAVELVVAEDRKPSICAPSLPTLHRGDAFVQGLKSAGGNGQLTWTLDSGALPKGVFLLPAGTLHGSPGESGTFEFRVKLSDSHPAGSRSDTREFRLEVGKEKEGTILVEEIAGKPSATTKRLAWEDIPVAGAVSLTRKALGQPRKSAVLSLRWSQNERSLFATVDVKDNGQPRTEDDKVELFLDVRNRREKMYNAEHDHRILIGKADKSCKAIYGDRDIAYPYQVEETDGGYRVRAKFPLGRLGREGARDYANFTLAFDAAVWERGPDGATSKTYWMGDERNNENPVSFGTIILVR